jgi:hypothetical protein
MSRLLPLLIHTCLQCLPYVHLSPNVTGKSAETNHSLSQTITHLHERLLIDDMTS